jgi:hypothetical protein
MLDINRATRIKTNYIYKTNKNRTHLKIVIVSSSGRLDNISNESESEYSNPLTDIKLNKE